ncbi:hypothetical protein RKD22_004733 [Streptomyces pristinaespiralis]
MGLSTSNPAFTKMTDVIAAVDKAKADIIAGTVKVQTAP